MTVDELVEELKVDLEIYEKKGLIDPISVARWMSQSLKPFGNNICELTETVVTVEDGRATLPSSFYSLYLAAKCDPHGFHQTTGTKKELQSSVSWRERTECGVKWNACDPCCKEEFDKIVVEKVYLETCEVECYYSNPVLLRLGKSMVKSACHAHCRNRVVRDCPYEISINNNTLYANFDGEIYMQYYGLPVDDSGLPKVPDTPQGYLSQYVEAFVKRRIFIKAMVGSDIPNANQMFQTYMQEERMMHGKALTDVKFSRLTPSSFNKLKRLNRAEIYKYSASRL